jgi:cyclophilin family peptidyl-prolyl cis-trans isomerase/HEAT repeat protein
MRRIAGLAVLLLALAPALEAQTSRLAVLQAEDRRALAPRDLAIIRAGLHSGDAETVRVAVRALGRLERPSLVGDIVPLLRHPLPEVRSEAANALGQAVQGVTHEAARASVVHTGSRGAAESAAAAVDGAVSALSTRLKSETSSSVRSAICETLGRIPGSADQTARIETTLAGALAPDASSEERLGIAKGLAAAVALHRDPPAAAEAIEALRKLAALGERDRAERDARVRRLALEGLISAKAVSDQVLSAAARDPDAQVRRLAMRASADTGQQVPSAAEVRRTGLTDSAAMVRLEALRAEAAASPSGACAASVDAVKDRDVRVVLTALDQLAACSESSVAVQILEQTVADMSMAASVRGWHRAAHALVSLAAVRPESASAALPKYTRSSVWQLRMYAARAETTLANRSELESLAADLDDNVVEAAVDGLVKVAGHAADAAYMAALSRKGYQAIRAGARALDGSPSPDAVPALNAALERLTAEGTDNPHDARAAIEKTLSGLGAARKARPSPPRPIESDLNADDLRRLASARARISVRGLGAFELALFTSEAPATVCRFARLADAGYYNGLTFHRVVPNFVIQGGSPGANEYIGDARFMRDELGLWPHVRGAVGISTRGRDTGDAQFFVDLVDNPRLDHQYTVFAQVLNGMDIVDQILEGDVIDKVEIVAN